MHVAYFCRENNIESDIVKMLEQYCFFKDFKFVIDKFKCENELFEVFEHKKYHIIFFDIEGKYDSCINAAAKIRKIDGFITIIFIAEDKSYAFNAFEVYPLDYILKPVKFERLESSLDRCCQGIKRTVKYINVNCNKINTKISVSNIIYIEVLGNTSCIHMASNAVVKTYMTLSELEEILSPNHVFIRTHRSYIVNMEFVSEMKKNCFIMKNGDLVAIRKNNSKVIRNIFNKFYYNHLS